MKITNKQINLMEVKSEIKNHLAALPSYVDSFYEDHLLASDFVRLYIDGQVAATVAVHANSMIVLFMVPSEFKQFGQELFHEAKRLKEVTCAYVPTCDEFYLSIALESAKKMDFQAYFFKETERPLSLDQTMVLEIATRSDVEEIQKNTGDFFNPIDAHIEKSRIYKGIVKEKVVSYGIVEKSHLFDHVASIGMIVLDSERQKGYGTMTIKALRKRCDEDHITPIAGCWYYNHQSRKTLQKAGFYSDTRMLKVYF